VRFHELAADLFGHPGDTFGVGAQPDPEHDGTAWTDERQAPFGCRRRFRQRLGNGDSIDIRPLLLRPTLDDDDIRRRPLAQEVALAADRFEQRYLAVGKERCQRNPRHASSRADVDDRPRKARNDVHSAQRVVQQHPPRFREIADSR
jgi:hypothetical protein